VVDELQMDEVVAEVRASHQFHTLILYGSRARGAETPLSDFDLLAITHEGTRVVRDARPWRDVYLDLFIYPDRLIKPAQLMQVRGGRVLCQERGSGDALLGRIERLYRRGPKPLPDDEVRARVTWAKKMLERARYDHLEGQFRRVWLLTVLLEDYFHLRGKWYEGPKLSLSWLQENDPQTYSLYEAALRPAAAFSDVESLVQAVTSVSDLP
jgi:uncharacterized protein